MIDDDALLIYSDGSSRGRPRAGGIVFRFVYNNDEGDEVTEDFSPPGYKGGNNNEMELKAVIEALKEAALHERFNRFSKIVVITDSQYVRDNIGNAKFVWPKTRWLRSGGAPVLNVELWKSLIREIRSLLPMVVEFQWVKGHSGIKHNDAADKLAEKSRTSVLLDPLTVVNLGKKTTKAQVEIGCVKMCGQRLEIQIISSKYLHEQKMYRYKYQVTSKGSKYFDLVDQICSMPNPPFALSRWHKYLVSLNNDTSNPIILKVLEERGTSLRSVRAKT